MCECDCEQSSLQINHPAPAFIADAYHATKDAIEKISLADLKGKWIILAFYPADFTYVCPTELEDLANHYDELKKLNVEVLSVSTDSAFAHKAWHDSSEKIKKITFPMVSDRTGDISRSYHVYIEEVGEALRGTFIINPDGLLKAYEINDTSLGRSSAELMRKIKAAQFVHEHGDQVCPANWEPGSATLKPGMDLVGKL